jgi:hypothetical protein
MSKRPASCWSLARKCVPLTAASPTDPATLTICQLPGTTHHPTLNGRLDISAISPDYTATLTSWLNDVVTTAAGGGSRAYPVGLTARKVKHY